MEAEHHRRISQLEAKVRQLEAIVHGLCGHLDIDPAAFIPPEPPMHQAIREALFQGDKIKAIKLYRELYRVDLRTAKEAIDAM